MLLAVVVQEANKIGNCFIQKQVSFQLVLTNASFLNYQQKIHFHHTGKHLIIGPGARFSPSSETQGQLSGSGDFRGRKFTVYPTNCPWVSEDGFSQGP